MKFIRLKTAADPNLFLNYAKQFGVTDSSVANVTDIAFRFTNGWSLYIGEDGTSIDGTELFWCNTLTPAGEDMGSAWKMTFDAVLQYIEMVGLREGITASTKKVLKQALNKNSIPVGAHITHFDSGKEGVITDAQEYMGGFDTMYTIKWFDGVEIKILGTALIKGEPFPAYQISACLTEKRY